MKSTRPQHRQTRRRPRPAVAVALALALAAGLSVVPVAEKPASAAPADEAADALRLLPLSTSADRRIVDSQDRDVLLRGANVNSLGEYWQGVPELDPTIPVSDADWAEMSAHGFSVIRLLITWSRVEPTRGNIDQDYLDEVDAYVRAAAEHGMYSVIDMHQDAYSRRPGPRSPTGCPPGTTSTTTPTASATGLPPAGLRSPSVSPAAARWPGSTC